MQKLLDTVLSNPKTSVGGVVGIIVGVSGLFGVQACGSQMSPETAVGFIIGGIVALFAADGKPKG